MILDHMSNREKMSFISVIVICIQNKFSHRKRVRIILLYHRLHVPWYTYKRDILWCVCAHAIIGLCVWQQKNSFKCFNADWIIWSCRL